MARTRKNGLTIAMVRAAFKYFKRAKSVDFTFHEMQFYDKDGMHVGTLHQNGIREHGRAFDGPVDLG